MTDDLKATLERLDEVLARHANDDRWYKGFTMPLSDLRLLRRAAAAWCKMERLYMTLDYCPPSQDGREPIEWRAWPHIDDEATGPTPLEAVEAVEERAT